MAKPKTAAADGKSTFYVLSNLNHDNVAYEPGDAAQLPDDLAETLAAIGVVSAVVPVLDDVPGADPAAEQTV